MGPLSFILEGGAEFAVDLFFPKLQRINHLKDNLFPLLNISDNNAEILISLNK